MSAEPWLKENGGVLDADKHRRLIMTREAIAHDARIPVELLWSALPEGLSAEERDWLKHFKQHRSKGYCGLLVTGECSGLDPLSRFGAMAGFLSRHLIRARLFSLNEVIESAVSGEPVVATCLMIPDFIASTSGKKDTPGWKTQQLSQLLMDRWSAGGHTQTVIYAPNVLAIEKEFGSFIANLVKNHYKTVTA